MPPPFGGDLTKDTHSFVVFLPYKGAGNYQAGRLRWPCHLWSLMSFLSSPLRPDLMVIVRFGRHLAFDGPDVLWLVLKRIDVNHPAEQSRKESASRRIAFRLGRN